VQDENKVVVEPDQDALAGPLDVLDRLARERFNGRINRSQDEGTVEAEMLETLADEARPERFNVGNDVGKLWQLSPIFYRSIGASRAILGSASWAISGVRL
jgi:hypothetical protein